MGGRGWIADRLYDTHTETLRKKGQTHGQEIQCIARQDVARGSGPCRCAGRGHAGANAAPGSAQGSEGDTVEVTKAMSVERAAVSKLERREDVCISTLREYVKVLGGELKLVASFPDAEIQVHPFKLAG